MPTLINEILEVPNEGDQITLARGTISIKGCKLNKWLKKLTGGKTPIVLFSNLLDKTHKVLHYFILKVLCPKSGIKSNVSNFESFLPSPIKHNHHINLGYLLI